MKRSTVLGGLAATALTVSAALAVTSPAEAAWVCKQGYVCIYENLNLTGSVAVLPELSPASGKYTGSARDFRDYTYTNGNNLNDSADSAINLTGKTIYFYEHGDFNKYKAGRLTSILPGQAWNFGYFEGELQDNRASSAKF
ncbi:hypothetical protein BJ973_004182 [Actinoplanes tereljensis]|uniref:Peptidase inhibitor family I36 n=1 Tax=Paractinoplanes tereljensis TaxID=571912 RepID=A0A919NRW3_9ACTN|nr:peptidase inhibitor family I36 protein [Actinoplanes tereljensis]GIF23573.1 hypothetical protein Ate02nite_63030 [Actinoplanes tereljensis]